MEYPEPRQGIVENEEKEISMAWYWWVLIIAAVLVIGWLKLSLFKKITANRKKKKEMTEED